MSSVPIFDLLAQYQPLKNPIRKAVERVFDTQRFVLGEFGAELERRVAAKCGVKHAVGLANGSDALFLTLQALGIGKGDEVITSAFTFFASAGSISRTGATPVFADIDDRTFNIHPDDLRRKITRRTKAIIPVHLFGLPCDMKQILRTANSKGIPVIEDACQALGARLDRRQAGSMGKAGCFSFYPTKNLGGAGDGGMAVTNSPTLASRLRLLRDHGQAKKYTHVVVGINSRLDEIQAAVLTVKLKRIDEWNRLRRQHAKAYDRGLRGYPVEVPHVPSGAEHVYHLYTIRAWRRDALADHLKKKNIGCGVYYPVPLHLQPCYRSLGYEQGDLTNTERACKEVLSLPLFPEMSIAQRDRVIAEVRRFFDQ